MEIVAGTPNARRRKPRVASKRLPYKDRPFIAWDGEGTGGDGGESNYILFGNSLGEDISSPRLRASECLKFICDVGERNPDAIHFWFAGTYDVTMMLASLPEEKRTQLVKEGKTFFWQYRLEFMAKKWFEVYDRERKVRVKIFDVFTFFACSAVKAWEQYLPGDPRVAEVKRGKDKRDSFVYEDLSEIRDYMHLELKLYVELMEKLRTLLAELGVHPTGWYGPGAVSGAVMKKFGVKNAMNKELPSEIVTASQHAYFGGRFEQFYTGLYEGPVYAYDIRSAYPHALRMVPNLQKGSWVFHEPESGTVRTVVESILGEGKQRPANHDAVSDFSLWHVRYIASGNPADRILSPQPLPYRDPRFAVHYPPNVEGWYWGCEAKAALQVVGNDIEVLGIWEFLEDDPNDRPFRFMEELYEKRAQWKREGNPVQLAAKLVLNSIYGKLAQRVGWNETTFQSPTWHQLEWAGFAVSKCRSMIWSAMSQNPTAMIAVETDGIYTTSPISVPVDNGLLGDWEGEKYTGIMYVQSGVYWIRSGDEWNKMRIRGFGAGDVTREEVVSKLDTLEPLQATTRRFAAITGFHDKDAITQWLERHPLIEWGGSGKRIHDRDTCEKCLTGVGQLHRLRVHYPHGGFSTKHVLPWIDAQHNPYWEDELNEIGSDIGVPASTVVRTESSAENRGTGLLSLLSKLFNRRPQRQEHDSPVHRMRVHPVLRSGSETDSERQGSVTQSEKRTHGAGGESERASREVGSTRA